MINKCFAKKAVQSYNIFFIPQSIWPSIFIRNRVHFLSPFRPCRHCQPVRLNWPLHYLVPGLVDDADVFLLGIQADDALGFALERADEQEGDAAYLEHVTDVAVLVNIDAVEVHLALVVLGDLSQDGCQRRQGSHQSA